MTLNMILLTILALIAQIITSSTSLVIYIKPTLTSLPCPSTKSCIQLYEYSQLHTKVNNTHLVFLPGEHLLSGLYLFENLVNFSMIGQLNAYGSSVIKCTDKNGSIKFDSMSNLVISDILLSGCRYDVNQTVSITKSQNVSILNSKFSDSRLNGSLFIGFSDNVEIHNTHFLGNRAYNGGALYVIHSHIQIIGCLFDNNSAVSYGGAVFIMESTAHIISSHFQRNQANYGGALCVDNNNISVSQSVFDSNEAIKYGGSLYGQSRLNSLEIRESQLINGKAISGGAAILYGGKMLVHNCTLANNSARAFGGALYVLQAFVTIELSFVAHNSVYEENQSFQSDSSGGAMYIARFSIVSIIKSQFLANYAHDSGGAIFAFINTNIFAYDTNFEQNYNLINYSSDDKGGGALCLSGDSYVFTNCSFLYNQAIQGGAIFNYFANLIQIKFCVLKGNIGYENGGAFHTCKLCITQLDNSLFINNTAQIGGAIYGQGSRLVSNGYLTFINNSCSVRGAIYLHNCIANFHGEWEFVNNKGSLYSFASGIMFTNKTIFLNNQEAIESSSNEGGAITLIFGSISFNGTISLSYNKARLGGAMYISNSKFYTLVGSTTVMTNNTAQSGAAIYCLQSELQLGAYMMLLGNTASHKGGGVMSISSTIMKLGNKMKLLNNQAKYGGGMYLQGNSMLVIEKTMPLKSQYNYLEFSENTADFGGALYVKDDTNSGTCSNDYLQGSQANCFFQIFRFYATTEIESQLPALVSASFSNNTAKFHGSSIYGGLLDRCRLSIFSEYLSVHPNSIKNSPMSILKKTVQFDELNPISSDPIRACFCHNGTLNCDNDHLTIHVNRGHPFIVSLVATDQALNPLPANILAAVSSNAGFKEGQTNQSILGECTELEYNIYSPNAVEHMVLYVDGPCMNKGLSQRHVQVLFEPCTCAIGFEPSNSSSICECVCNSQLEPYITNCSLNKTLNKESDLWMGYSSGANTSGFLIFQFCPYDYCIDTANGSVVIDLNIPNGADMQCAFNRSGILCGSCLTGYSLAFGSSRCLKCTNGYLSLIVGFAVAGIALVGFILALNMTVATGTINGLIFYANIVIANRSVFLPNEVPAFLSVFIAWLNLDLGIETCFYNGMDMYAKNLLQVVFPTYVLVLVLFLILVCRYSKRVTTLIGKKNPVATLATLILLSFAKFIRIIIKSLSFGHLQLPDGSSELLWLPDGNIEFLSRDHILQIIVAAIIIAIGLMFTLLLLFEKCLKRCSKWKVMKCFNNTKLHGFMDAYYAPYNPIHCYWVGLLLFVRIVLYLLTIGFNSEPRLEHKATMLAIIGTVFFLVLLKQFRVRVYKNWVIDILETSFLINLGIFAAATYHLLSTDARDKQFILACVSVSIAMLTFLIVCLHHTYTYLIHNSCLGKYIYKQVCKCSSRSRSLYSHLPAQHENTAPLNSAKGDEHQYCSVSYTDNVLREPDLDVLAPLNACDWETQKIQEQQLSPELKNVVTYSIIEGKPPKINCTDKLL